MWAKYEHNCVRWTLPLKDIEPRTKDGQTVEVDLAAGRSGLLTVAALVKLSECPEIKLAKQGDKIEVRGRIEFVQPAFIGIHDAKLAVLKE